MNSYTKNLDFMLSMTGLKFYEPDTLLSIMKNLDQLEDISIHPTESKIVHQLDKMKLRHYKPYFDSRPALIIYALINALYVLDLTEQTSLISGLTDQGVNVYALDWGHPAGEDRWMDFDDYLDYIDEAVDLIRERTGYDKIDLILECQGGTLGLIYTALYPEKIRKIITLSTPVDFSVPSVSFNLARNMDVDAFIDALGLVPGIVMNSNFFLLYPFDALMGRYLEFLKRGEDMEYLREFFRLESWIYSGPKLVGQFLRTWLKKLCIDNELYRGVFEAHGQVVDLRRITSPILNIVGTEDTIAPPESSKELSQLVGSSIFEELEYDKDHISMITTSFTRDELAVKMGEFLMSD